MTGRGDRDWTGGFSAEATSRGEAVGFSAWWWAIDVASGIAYTTGRRMCVWAENGGWFFRPIDSPPARDDAVGSWPIGGAS